MSIERRYALLGHVHSAFDEAVTFNAAVTFNSTVDFNGAVTVDAVAMFSVQPVFDAGIQLNDSDKAMFGTDDDLQIYHDGTNGFIDNVTGHLCLRAIGSGNHLHVRANDTTDWFDFHAVAATDMTIGDGVNSTSATLHLDAPAATNKRIRWQTNGVNRWILHCDNTAESGSDAGAQLEWFARKDDGTASYTLLTATRATAQIQLVGGVGTTSNPNWGFIGDVDTGVLRPAANEVSLVAGGTETLAVTATDVTVTGDLVVTGSITGTGAIDGEQAEVLTADEVITSDDVYSDIGNLVITGLTAGEYIFEAFLHLEVNSTPDMKRRFHFTGTATKVAMTSVTVGAAAANTFISAFDSGQNLTVTGEYGCSYQGSFVVTATGDLSFQAAQITSSATSITVYEGSWIRIRKGS